MERELQRLDPASGCQAFRGSIIAKLDAGLSAKRNHKDLIRKLRYLGPDYSVRWFVAQLEQNRCCRFSNRNRRRCGKQVDFGTAAVVSEWNTGSPVGVPVTKRTTVSHRRKTRDYSSETWDGLILRILRLPSRVAVIMSPSEKNEIVLVRSPTSSVPMSFSRLISQKRMVLSSLPVINWLPIGANATATVFEAWPVNSATRLNVFAS